MSGTMALNLATCPAVAAPEWTAQEETTIARIMAGEKLTRIKAIQAIQRTKSTSRSLSRRLNLQDAFDSSARCQNDGCTECALASEADSEMVAFLDIMLNGKQHSGEYFLDQRDPVTGVFPVSARMDDPTPSSPEADGFELVPKVPHEFALELTKDGVIEGLVYVRRAKSWTAEENAVRPTPEASAGENVDGLMAFPAGTCLDTPDGKPIKPLRGRPRLPEKEKRLAASERQARWRRRQRSPLADDSSLRTGDLLAQFLR